MEIKTKIIKIVPFWLIGLLIICSVVIASSSQNFNDNVQAQAPQVLGESTSVSSLIRGQETENLSAIKQLSAPDTSNISAAAFLVFDLQTGQNLLQKNPEQKLAIASLTKLMTGLVAYNNVNLNSDFKITAADVLNVDPSLGLRPGDEVSTMDIFNAMLIGSCNDAALALSNYISSESGKNFVSLMNGEAQNLGLQNTNFANPLGFDSKSNYSTANDLKKLITQTQTLSAFTDLGRRSSYEFSGTLGKKYFAKATNTLIKNYPDIQAIKTGYTQEANGAMATKVEVSGREIVILVLDSQNREDDTLKLKADLTKYFNID